mgnify:CR=1 FL=1
MKETKFKVGDCVVVKSYSQCGEGNGISTSNYVTKLLDLGNEHSINVTGCYWQESNFRVLSDKVRVHQPGHTFRIKESHIIRHATSQEIHTAGLTCGETNDLYKIY